MKLLNIARFINNSNIRFYEFIKIIKFLILIQIHNPLPKKIAIIYSLSHYQQKDLINIISKNGSKQKFPISKLNEKNCYIIESRDLLKMSCQDSEIILFPYPLLILIFNRYLSNIIVSIVEIVSTFFQVYLKKTWSLKDLLILKCLNNYTELDIFTTISILKDYPIEFSFPKSSRQYVTHVIHYSQNSVEITFEDEHILLPKNSIVDGDSLGDIHWLWTESFANYLKKFNNKIDFRAVGSITFKINESRMIRNQENLITLFDITPHTSLEGKSFYNFDLAKHFLDDVIEIKNMIDIFRDYKIQIKQKRQLNNKYHHEGYLSQLSELEKQNKIRIIPWDANPYKIISESRIIISVPFTSIALIGKELQVPSIYYYPFMRRISNYIYSKEIPLICGKVHLMEFLIKEIKVR